MKQQMNGYTTEVKSGFNDCSEILEKIGLKTERILLRVLKWQLIVKIIKRMVSML